MENATGTFGVKRSRIEKDTWMRRSRPVGLPKPIRKSPHQLVCCGSARPHAGAFKAGPIRALASPDTPNASAIMDAHSVEKPRLVEHHSPDGVAKNASDADSSA